MYSEQTITTSATPTVIIERVGGNLIVGAGEEEQVWVRSHGEEFNFEHNDDQVILRIEPDGELTVPIGAALIVKTVHGNAKIEHVEGEITVKTVHGNLTLLATGPVSIEDVSGNLSAQEVHGDLTAARVNGNAHCQEIDAGVQLEMCRGDLHVRHAEGDVKARVFGNALLNVAPQPGHTIEIVARGNIHCRIPTTTDSQVSLKAKGNVNVSRLPIPQPGEEHAFTLGDGTGRITLEALGNVTLAGYAPGEEDSSSADFEFDFDFGQAEEIMRQFSEQMEAQARELSRQFEARLADLGTGDELAAKVQEKVQRALRQAEEKIANAARRAEEKANRRAERAARRGRRGHREQHGPHGPMARGPMSPGVVVTPPTPPVPPRPPRPAAPATPAVSDEERMHILRMLEEGKISVDQAETLLAALEG